MDSSNGNIYTQEQVPFLSTEIQKRLIPFKRALTLKEKNDKQLRLYSSCGCGSGKKFKFCCWTGNMV